MTIPICWLGKRYSLALIVAWYDLWVGAYIDWSSDRPPGHRLQRLYILPIPCIGFVITREAA